MPLPTPKLDLRSFEQLLESARKVIGIYDTWTDRTAHDPGMILLEAFAHLTEVLIYRVNRLPERAHIELLRLLGVQLLPATAAEATLRFQVKKALDAQVRIPRRTRVGAKAGGVPLVFSTVEEAVLEPRKTAVEVLACHCQMESESLGAGTGRGGQRFTARQPFVDAGRHPELRVALGVEVGEQEELERGERRVEADKTYRLWQEVDSFSPGFQVRHPYLLDRATGTVQFAPALRMVGGEGAGLSEQEGLIAEVPPNQRDIRIWGPRGGGKGGNVPAGTLVRILDPIPGVELEVSNPHPAAGGSDAESLSNALLRGAMTFRTLQRAISAADYEWLAVQASKAVRRAKAFAQRDLWCFAEPGTVEVVLVPGALPDGDEAPAGLEPVRREVLGDLEGRKALGTFCEVSWARYKPVSVKAKVVVRGEEDLAVAKRRLEERLAQSLDPLSESALAPTWKFGTPLRVSTVYDIVLADPGVHRMEQLRLCVEEAPNKDIQVLERDNFQKNTWYAGGPVLFRSLNDGASWEPVLRPDEGVIRCVQSHPTEKGLLAAAVAYRVEQDGIEKARSRVFVSRDCGERWDLLQETSEVHDLAWLPIEGKPIILIATAEGLFRGPLDPDSRDRTVPVQIIRNDREQAIYAAAAFLDPRGDANVAVAMSRNRGIYLSKQGGRQDTFEHIGPTQSLNIQRLAVQREGTQIFLWAGTGASGGVGQACWRRDFRGVVDGPDGWEEFSRGWKGGACYDLAFADPSWLLAATGDRGVLRLDLTSQNPSWVADETFQSGLPQKGARELFHDVPALAARSGGDHLVLAGGPEGVYRSRDLGERFSTSCQTEFTDEVSLPRTWLIRSGTHDLEVEYDLGQA